MSLIINDKEVIDPSSIKISREYNYTKKIMVTILDITWIDVPGWDGKLIMNAIDSELFDVTYPDPKVNGFKKSEFHVVETHVDANVSINASRRWNSINIILRENEREPKSSGGGGGTIINNITNIDSEIVSDTFETNLNDFALIPNIELVNNKWRWKNNIKSFKDIKNKTERNFFFIKNNDLTLYNKKLIIPSDINNIYEDDVMLLKYNNKQLYFTSLTDFSAGLTTLSPKVYNKSIDSITEDMYKCRCLQINDSIESTIFKLSSSFTSNTRELNMIFNSLNGNEYGNIYRESNNDVTVYKKFNGIEYKDIIFKIYQNDEEAIEDAINMPDYSVGIIKRGDE